jgi:C4-dicarboxylate-specific signal transduction histidine kinase
MAQAGSRELRRRGEGLTAFQRLQAQARRLERSIFVLVALIALAPPLVVSLAGIRMLRARAAQRAERVASILEAYGRMPQASLAGLERHLAAELERDGLRSIRLSGGSGAELRLGSEPGFTLPVGVRRELPAGARFARVEVLPDDSELRADLARLVAVHLLVGLVLGLGIYRIPVRAFASAIDELQSAQAQLVHADRLSALGSVYAGLTHEINNPLGILSARVKLALGAAAEKRLDADTVRDLEVMDRQCTRIGEIMRSLLAFARKSEFSPRQVDLNAVVREVVALVQKPFAKQGVLVQTELDPALPELRASPDHLQQVLLNLLTNARDAMPSGGMVTLRTTRRNGRLVAEVKDTGPGLKPEALEHLFEPFFTTKEIGKGTGLGLSVSYGIVSAHGGELDAGNAPGGGALFRISLPAGEGGGR